MSPQRLDQTLTELAAEVMTAAQDTPLAIEQIAADLPMEFSLTTAGDITARPPFALQSRALALPVARMSVTFQHTGGRHD
ncbi:MAG: hypothetical protein AB8B82_04115 [Roseovarius sp.]